MLAYFQYHERIFQLNRLVFLEYLCFYGIQQINEQLAPRMLLDKDTSIICFPAAPLLQGVKYAVGHCMAIHPTHMHQGGKLVVILVSGIFKNCINILVQTLLSSRLL